MADHSIERCFDKVTYLSFPSHHHTQHTGHDPADRDRLEFGTQKVRDTAPVLQGKRPGKIDSHQIIFLCPQICRGGKIVVLRNILCFSDPPQDLLLRL